MKKIKYFLIGVITLLSTASNAEVNEPKYIENFDLKPVILDSEETDSSTLGLEYLLAGKLFEMTFDVDEGDDLVIDPDAPIGGYDVSYSLQGVITENYKNNPKNFLESRISANYFKSSKFTFKAGAFLAYESDQKFDNYQLLYGLTGTFAKIDNFADNDSISAHLNLAQVDPSEDASRELILGSDPGTYTRLDVELLYIYNIGTEYFDTFEANLRYFFEIDPEKAIKDADLDNFRLITYRLGFKNNFYIAYCSGELPFNQKDNQIYELGFSYKFY